LPGYRGGTSANQVRSVSLPALTKVGRDLSLTIARNGTGGDASLRGGCGLSSLKSVGGDVTVISNAGDLYGCSLADALAAGPSCDRAPHENPFGTWRARSGRARVSSARAHAEQTGARRGGHHE
jgi:hypothetical protein